MKEAGPRAIVAVMIGIVDNVRSAAHLAGLADVPQFELPFPARPEHRERYVDELSSLLRRLRGEGILRRLA